ncbi:hypothetical protein [Pararhizobium sp. IMCC21322]|uniref:hypothetical protein n=1 Tax=Pararhizobium sp. IMCC21322 TaxID=3067903 RepID=UPI0027425D51|nr:hypothetical protein [Pararhizobium sp. IMCC21322]
MATKRKPKQAVVVIHGMGEQMPMEMVNSFTDAVWVQDPDLVARSEPDPNTGDTRTQNAIWSKPDRRNRSHELHRLTTESDVSGRRTDFFEFYWAHRIHGTTLDQITSWVVDLLIRNPFKRVPRDVLSVWLLMWFLTLVFVAGTILAAAGIFETVDDPGTKTVMLAMLGLISTALFGWIKQTVLIKILGDVVRYTKAKPLNIARRQEIREKGVELLETLMGVENDPQGSGRPKKKPPYDRIIVVAHSLGTIVAYDVLSLAYARINQRLDAKKGAEGQTSIKAFETKISGQISQMENGQPGQLDIDEFQADQARAAAELTALGSPWVVSDFVTLGSPLTHAEFLMSYDEDALINAQTVRQLPTCPPQMEFDVRTQQKHFTYLPRYASIEEDTRMPHHAALFAFTRWTNIYSPRKNFLWGDIVSGPVGQHFGLSVKDKKTGETQRLSGIRDIAVLPERKSDGTPKDGLHVPFMTHVSYWNMNANAGEVSPNSPTPHHIQVLRRAINLLRT